MIQKDHLQALDDSVQILGGIVFAVSDIGHDRGALLAGGGEGGVHALPGGAIEEDDVVHPAGFLGPNADPGVIGAAGIAYHQLAGDAEAADHTRHQGCVVKADALFLCQHRVQDRQIAAFDRGGPLIVVAEVFDNIVVNGGHLLQGIGDAPWSDPWPSPGY